MVEVEWPDPMAMAWCTVPACAPSMPMPMAWTEAACSVPLCGVTACTVPCGLCGVCTDDETGVTITLLNPPVVR